MHTRCQLLVNIFAPNVLLGVAHETTPKKNVWCKNIQQKLTSRVQKKTAVRVPISILQASTVIIRISSDLSEHYSSNKDFELRCPNPRNETISSLLLVQLSLYWSGITLVMIFHHNNHFGTDYNPKNYLFQDLVSECGTPYEYLSLL